MNAFGATAGVSQEGSHIVGEAIRPTGPSINHVLFLAPFDDAGVTHWPRTDDGNGGTEDFPDALMRWLDSSLRYQRENLRAYVQGGDPNELEKRLDVRHYRLSGPWPNTDPKVIFFQLGVAVNLAFLRAQWRANDANAPTSCWRILNLLETIEQAHGAITLSLAECARQMRICPDYLGQLFKNTVGVAFRPFLRMYRVVCAAQLLNTTGWTLDEIASIFGHAQSSHFAGEFREALGLSPSHFRKLHGEPSRTPASTLDRYC